MTRGAMRATASILALLMTGGAAAVAEAPMPEAPLPEAGQEAPDFTLPLLDGDTATLSERRSQGPVVLVFVRGVW